MVTAIYFYRRRVYGHSNISLEELTAAFIGAVKISLFIKSITAEASALKVDMRLKVFLSQVSAAGSGLRQLILDGLVLFY